MSLPSFDKIGKIPGREEALNAIIISVAMEEKALALIMKAESEKLRYATEHLKLGNCDSPELLLEFNKSVERTIASIKDLQAILKEKLRLAVDCSPKPPKPPIPPKPPPPSYTCDEFMEFEFPFDAFYPPQKEEFFQMQNATKCVAVLHANENSGWHANSTLQFSADVCHCNENTCGIKPKQKFGSSFIELPKNTGFDAGFNIVLHNPYGNAVAMKVCHETEERMLFERDYEIQPHNNESKFQDVLNLGFDADSKSFLSFKLLGDRDLYIAETTVTIKQR